jgi:hypothetical protein
MTPDASGLRLQRMRELLTLLLRQPDEIARALKTVPPPVACSTAEAKHRD